MPNNSLAQLYSEHTGKVSDKWSLYLSVYERILNPYRDKPINLLEIGIQNGGSLEIWAKYFANARKLVGCDVDPECARLVYGDPRIAAVVGDINSDDVQSKVLEYAPTMDVILDDGSHRSGDIVNSFARYFPYLADGGLYVAEDLHCSYWKGFEGGLFDPFSSLTFFKRLADAMNHEHWGVAKKRADIFSGFSEKYSARIDEEILAHVHSIEFVNSICVIRKDRPENNSLGQRVVVGWLGAVVPGNKLLTSLTEIPDQTDNEWTSRSAPPDEEFLSLVGGLAERDGQVASLGQAVAERDGQVASLSQAVAERDGQVASLSQAVAEGETRIANLQQAVIERDAVIATLNQTITEREEQAASLDQAITERDGLVASLNQAVTERDTQIANLNQAVSVFQNSNSWRLTKPLRHIGKKVRRGGRELKKIKGDLARIGAVVRHRETWSSHSLKTKIRSRFIKEGHAFYRRWLKGTRLGQLIKNQNIKRGYVTPVEIQISALTQADIFVPSRENVETPSNESDVGVPGFHLSPPLNIVLSDVLALRPHINVMLPGLRMQNMSGGPNTALLLAAHLAKSGRLVRVIATDLSIAGEEAALYSHMDGLFQRPVDRGRITVVDGSDRSQPLLIGADDLFLATAWWTAQMAKYAVRKTRHHQFLYLIQDFEPILHEGSTFQALALETYGLPHIPIVNTRLLLDHLIKEGCGCYAQPDFSSGALFFEPAIDRTRYFPELRMARDPATPKRRVLLFYARPTFARRNLFELGVVALRRAVAAGHLDSESWEIWGMGESFEAIPLGNNVFLRPLPWMSFDAYAERVRTADLLLSLMLSPHPSYPPLEMAASGKLVVTNSFSVKTAERMQTLSPNIIVAAPTLDGVAAALESAVGRINAGLPSYDPSGTIDLPLNWDESLGDIIPGLNERIDTLRRTPLPGVKPLSNGYPANPNTDYERFRKRRLAERRSYGQYYQKKGLLSFVTPVYDTDPKFLEELAGSVFLQDGGTDFEWLILDNGSTNENTCTTLRAIAEHPCVRLERVDKNIGIIRGMRYGLEHASGRYILPLDSDDLIEPDCVHVLTRALDEAKYPALLYTDEDKLADDRFGTGYFKPGWDPVLFVHSCYIAHLCAIDREKALALNAYSDQEAEGCHDWDSFIRFMNAGYVPLHVPEVLYSWRVHSQSTSGNISSKSYISESHRATLQKFLNHKSLPNIQLQESPLFTYGVDWWLRRQRVSPLSYLSIFVGRELANPVSDSPPQHTLLDPEKGLTELAIILEGTSSELVHLCWEGIKPDSDEWYWEAMALVELFPDTVMVGGTLHDGKKVLSASRNFGFGDGFDCPDFGRPLSDPGYFAQMWKPHSVCALSVGHCVVRCDFLKRALAELQREKVHLNMLGLWLGALARETEKRVVFSPFMGAFAESIPENNISPASRASFISRFWHLMPDELTFSSKLALNASAAYMPASNAEREQHLKQLQCGMIPYSDWFNLELLRRANRYPIPGTRATLSILTAVYEGSNISLLEELADCIRKQTVRPAQWVIVANGPMLKKDLQLIRDKAETQWGATLVVEPHSLGIIGALRRGLECAEGQYIIPVDADDVLTLDAVQVLTHEIERLQEPELIFSDEDILMEGRFASPYLRSAFDPVLNLESSYIWHLCAIKRATALQVGLYTDAKANWCQDWDSVTRIANASGRIEHVSAILYHWRQHSGSTTNKRDGDPRSLDSIRNNLQQQISRTANPERYSVEFWPNNRGAKELYIARRNIELPRFLWIGDIHRNTDRESLSEDAILMVTTGDVSIESDGVFIEVVRLLELHPNIAGVGGCIIDKNDLIIDGCLVINQKGGLESPWVGHHIDNAAPYALALKPQTVASTGRGLGFFRISALKSMGLWPLEQSVSVLSWMLVVSDQLVRTDGKVAFSPLVRARSNKTTPIVHEAYFSSKQKTGNSAHALARYSKYCPHDFRWG